MVRLAFLDIRRATKSKSQLSQPDPSLRFNIIGVTSIIEEESRLRLLTFWRALTSVVTYDNLHCMREMK